MFQRQNSVGWEAREWFVIITSSRRVFFFFMTIHHKMVNVSKPQIWNWCSKLQPVSFTRAKELQPSARGKFMMCPLIFCETLPAAPLSYMYLVQMRKGKIPLYMNFWSVKHEWLGVIHSDISQPYKAENYFPIDSGVPVNSVSQELILLCLRGFHASVYF